MALYYGDIVPYFPVLLHGLWVAIYVTAIAMVGGGGIGMLLYLGRNRPYRLVRGLCTGYVEGVRNTPLLVQLYLIYFALPAAGISLSAILATIVGLTLHNAAYMAEIYRAGFESVPDGLSEAGSALGMGSRQTLRYVLLGPAIRNVFPALTNQTILMFLATSVASIIALPDLMSAILNVNSATYRTIEVLSVGGLLYFITCAVFAALAKAVEKTVFSWAANE